MKKQFVFLSVLMILINFGFSQEKIKSNNSQKIKKLSVKEAVNLAFENNISLKQQKINLDLLEKRNNFSWNSVSPSLSASGNFTPDLENTDNYSWSVSGSIRLNLSPSLYTSIKTAKLNYESGKTSFEEATKTIEQNVRKLFYSLVLDSEKIALQQRNIETAKIRYENNLAKFNRGQLSELSLLQSQYSYENLRPKLESALINYENNLANFKQLLGIEQTQKIEFEGNLEQAILGESIEISILLEDIPSIKKINKEIEAKKNQLLATRFSAWGPSLSVSYSYGKSGQKNSDNLRTSNSLSLGVSIPLDGYLPWSNGALNIDAQKSELKNLELKLKNEETAIMVSLQNDSKKIIQMISQMSMLKQNIEIAQKTFNMTQNAYNVGSVDLLNLQNSIDSLMSAQVEEKSQMYNLICAVLDLELKFGLNFDSIWVLEE